jgi:acetyl esterase/lipase
MPKMPAAPPPAAGLGVKEPTIKYSEETVLKIPMRDGYESELIIHKPTNSAQGRGPLIVLIYGGGFMMGSNTSFAVVAKALVQLHGATVINLSYRLAPAYKFPTAPHDVWDTLVWVSENIDSLDVDLSKGYIVGGASAGANLAAAASQNWLTEKRSPTITGVWLNVPSVLATDIVPEKYKDLYISRGQLANAMILNKESMDRITAAYQADIYSPDYSPFNIKGAHTGMPPVYFQVCGADPLRDDGLIYEKVLKDHGVKTKMDVYPGVPHGHAMFTGLKAAKKASNDSLIGIAWLLGKQTSDEEAQQMLRTVESA